jgi:hypothetical protein
MPERYRPLLAHPRDDFIEATKNVENVAGGGDDLELADGAWAEVVGLVTRYGGEVIESGLAEPDHVPFSGFRDGRHI